MHCFCAQTRQAARLLTTLYEDALRPAGLTPAQFELLTTLHYRGPIAQAPLAAAMALDATTLSRNLKPLAIRSLLTRTANPQDARETLYALTPQGEATRKQAHSQWQRVHKRMERRLGPQAAAALAALQSLQQAAAAL